jgi:D-xylose transport system ATP-binding protein
VTAGSHTDATSAPVVEVIAAGKRFGAVTALNGVDLRVMPRQIVALLGDNGAGKSTLIKCLSGVHRLDEGQVLLAGSPVSPRTPHEARSLGIETVYQDLALFDNLSAADNLFAGRERSEPRALGWFGALRGRQMREHTASVLRRLEVGVSDPDLPVGLMSGGQRQAIAVARAETFATRLMILDEPTAALGVRESRNVVQLVKRLPEKGIAVLLISHNLEEVMEVADHAIVLRAGRKVGEARPRKENHARIVSMIVGARADSSTSGADGSGHLEGGDGDVA